MWPLKGSTASRNVATQMPAQMPICPAYSVTPRPYTPTSRAMLNIANAQSAGRMMDLKVFIGFS